MLPLDKAGHTWEDGDTYGVGIFKLLRVVVNGTELWYHDTLCTIFWWQ